MQNLQNTIRRLLPVTLALGIACFAAAYDTNELRKSLQSLWDANQRWNPEFRLFWNSNLLTVTSEKLPGGKLEVWYPEAFCRKGSTDRDWGKTVWRTYTSSEPMPERSIRFDTTILPRERAQTNSVLIPDGYVWHEIHVKDDTLDISFKFLNRSDEKMDLEWLQPACIRVGAFTGCNQSNYTARSFIFTERGLTMLETTDRRPETDARYHGGQVYVPKGINTNDVNPRPICHDQPTNGLIGCFSADGKYLLAVASDSTHELFEGVYVRLHSDPHVGGLKPHETKTIHSKIYFMTNDVPALLKRYQADFPGGSSKSPAGF